MGVFDRGISRVSNPLMHPAMTGRVRVTRRILALVGFLLAGSAGAQSIDASNYAVGTNISNAIPGVTLSFIAISDNVDDGFLQQGASLSALSYTSSPLSVELGTMSNGDTYNVLGGYTGQSWGGQALIFVQFAQPISAFSAVSLNDAGDTNDEYLFNASGVDVASVTSLGTNSCAVRFDNNPTGFCQYWNTGGTYQSSTPISAMMIGSFSAAGYVLSIDATPVAAPEIDASSAASALTLLLGSFVVLRSRRAPRMIASN
jgi:hypothetical protein